MNHRLFNAYFDLMDEGLVPKICCGNDSSHARPYVKFDTDYENWHLECPACNWKMKPGMRMEDEIRQVMALHDVEWLTIGVAND